eukprot:3106723-Prymnesium_polylepis.1
MADVLEHPVGVHELDGDLGERDQFGLARRERDAMLPAGRAVDGGAGEEDGEPGRRSPLRP